jgi:hypothetical protein
MHHPLDPTVLIFGGSSTLIFGLWSFQKKRERLKYWIRAKGSVENLRREKGDNVFVRIRYSDEAGTARACWLPYADGDRIGLGTEVVVAYNPRFPDDAFIADKTDMNLTAISAIIVGGIMIGCGILAFRIWLPD